MGSVKKINILIVDILGGKTALNFNPVNSKIIRGEKHGCTR